MCGVPEATEKIKPNFPLQKQQDRPIRVTYDVTYFLSSESQMEDWELRYSLRSVEKFFSSLRRVWILGEHKPRFLNEKSISRIALPDCYKNNKDANLISKLVRASMEPELSEKFVSCSDDHIILRPLNPQDFKPYFTGDLTGQTVWKKDKWHNRMRRTRDALRDRGYPQRDYEGHIPYMLDKTKIHTYLNFDYGNPPGYGVFTLYFNTVDTPGAQYIGDERVRAGFFQDTSPENTKKKLSNGNKFLAFNDGGFNETLRVEIEKLLPEPSSYEIL